MRPAPLLSGLLAAILLVAPAAAQQAAHAERVSFPHGQSSATLTGTLRGDADIDYLVGARAGQTMRVTLRPTNRSTYFNVLPPGSEEAIFIGPSSGDRFEGRLPADGDYRIRVFLMRNAARRGEATRFTLEVAVTGGAPAPHAGVAHPTATGTMPCSFGRPSLDAQCAWHVERRAPDVALIRIERPSGGPRLLSVTHGQVAAQGAPVQARRQDDMWTVTVGGREHYRFADALLTGG